MTVDEIREIGIKLHEGSKKNWIAHPRMVESYMRTLCMLKLHYTPEEMVENGYEEFIQKIAYGHDLLKKVKGTRTVTYNGNDYTVDVPDVDHPLMTKEFNVMCPEVLKSLAFEEEEIKVITDELISVGKYHGLNAAAWLYSQGEMQVGVLVPIMMHQCQVPTLYRMMPEWLRVLTEITLLADKCSKNSIKAYVYHQPVPVLLMNALFGPDGHEFNYSSALLLARIIQEGKNPSEIQKASTRIFRDRCVELGLPVPKKCRLSVLTEKGKILVDEQTASKMKEDLISVYGSFYNENSSGAESTGEESEKSN